MKTTRIMTVAALIVAGGLALHVALAQQPGVTRNDLQRHDLSIPGREAIQTIVAIAPGVTAPRHSHPGEEIIYVLEGMWSTARWTTAGHAQGGRRLVHPCRSSPLGEERRQRQRGGARHVHRRKREAARRAGQVSALRALLTELRLTTRATARLPNRECIN